MKEITNVVFVCLANQNRSPTAEDVFKETLNKNNVSGYEVKSAGIDPFGGELLNPRLFEWADIVFALDTDIYKAIKKHYWRYKQPEKIHNLKIPDVYYKDDTELRERLYKKLNNYLKEKGEI